jgi:hypothetical protein
MAGIQKFCLLYKWRWGAILACTGLSVADATVTDARYCFKAVFSP